MLLYLCHPSLNLNKNSSKKSLILFYQLDLQERFKYLGYMNKQKLNEKINKI